MLLFLRSLFWTVVLPGVVSGYIPWRYFGFRITRDAFDVAGIAGLVLFLLIAEAWYRWGFLAMFLAIAALALLGGWIVDRRNAKRAY